MEWNVETLNHTVDEELNALPADMRARFTRVVRLIESFGVDRVGQPHVKHLQGRLWEMRLQGRDGIARALYVTVTGQRVVVVRVFVGRHLRRDSLSSILYAEELNSIPISATRQTTDRRHEILDQKSADFQVAL